MIRKSIYNIIIDGDCARLFFTVAAVDKNQELLDYVWTYVQEVNYYNYEYPKMEKITELDPHCYMDSDNSEPEMLFNSYYAE